MHRGMCAVGTPPPVLPKLSALQWKILQDAVRGWSLRPLEAEPERVARSRAISRLVTRGIVARVKSPAGSRYTSRIQIEIIVAEEVMERAALKAAARDRDRGIKSFNSPAGWFLYLMKDARRRRGRERRRQEWREECKREQVATRLPPSRGRLASQRGAVASYAEYIAKQGKDVTPEAITACIGDLSGFDLETVTAHLEWLEDEGHLARIIAAAAAPTSGSLQSPPPTGRKWSSRSWTRRTFASTEIINSSRGGHVGAQDMGGRDQGGLTKGVLVRQIGKKRD